MPSNKTKSLARSMFSNFGLLVILLFLLLIVNFDSINLIWYFSLAILVFTVVLIFALIFISQFLFPLKRMEQRSETVLHLLRFILGKTSLIAIIRDGHVLSSDATNSKKQVGAIWLDSASAVVVENPIGIQRVFSGGFWFLSQGERIVDVVSLKKQTRTLGPQPLDKPFISKQLQETTEMYNTRAQKAKETLAVTVDGSEVYATIFIDYQIENKASLSQNGFGFDPNSIKKAVETKFIQKDSNPYKLNPPIAWESVAPSLAVKIWKEIAQHSTLEQLVSTKDTGPSPLNIIGKQIKERLTQATLNQTVDENEIKTGRRVNSEFRELKTRGIRVNNVEVTHLHINELNESTILNEWSLNTLREGELLRKNIEQRIFELDGEARTQALLDFSYALARFSKNQSPRTVPPLLSQLTTSLKGILYLIRHNPLLVKNLEKDYQQLTNLNDFLIEAQSKIDE